MIPWLYLYTTNRTAADTKAKASTTIPLLNRFIAASIKKTKATHIKIIFILCTYSGKKVDNVANTFFVISLYSSSLGLNSFQSYFKTPLYGLVK